MNNRQKQKILIIGKVWPEPGSSAAGARMMQMISALTENGWEVFFGSAAARNDYSADLSDVGVEVVNVQLNNASFDQVIRSLQPDAVLFDRFMTEEQFGWRVAEQCPDALRILDTEDLHSLRYAREKAVEQGEDFKHEMLFREDLTKREIASILRSDMSLIISGFEMKLLEEVFDIQPELLHYLPYLLEEVSEQAADSWPGFEERFHFLIIGNFLHKPNVDSVRYLKEAIWPLIRRELPHARMHVYGAYPDQKIFDLQDDTSGFFINGRVKDARQVMRQARVCLAPLRFGAGLKGKLVEAMRCGTPSVTTTTGAEGIAGRTEWCGFVEDDPERFALAAVRLYSDQAEWEQARLNGIRIINNRFSKKRHVPAWLEHMNELRENLDEHRLQNFAGSMLMHHTTASTRYMSKWIEAKNS